MIGTVPADRICHRKPTSVTYNGVFVVDLSCVHCIDDLRADDNGVWTHAGKPRRKYCIRRDPETCGLIYADPGDEPTPESEICTLVRIYHHDKGTPEFQRRISYVLVHDGQKVQYAVVQYLFDGGNEVPVIIPPHGNAKKVTASYRRTQKSRLSKSQASLKMLCLCYMMKLVEAWVLPARVNSLVIIAKYTTNYTTSSGAKPGKIDPLFELVQQCKADLMPGGRRFIQSVNFDTSPSCVLAMTVNFKVLLNFVPTPVLLVF